MSDRSRRIAIGFAVLAMVLGGSASASAQPLRTEKVIDVFPGPNALANALAEAQPGDTLRIHTGTFDEAVTVTTASLTIVTAGDGPVTITAGCASETTMTIQGDGTILDGGTVGDLVVEGGSDKDIDIVNSNDVMVHAVTVSSVCDSPFAGILVEGGHGIRIVHNATAGDFDGIYVSNVSGSGSPIVVAGNDVTGGREGIEVSGALSGVVVKVIDNTVHGAEIDGIRLVNADGVIVRHNTVTQTDDGGIVLLDDVRNARVVRNVVLTNGTDLSNGGGKSNCFRRNEHHSQDGWIGCRP